MFRRFGGGQVADGVSGTRALSPLLQKPVFRMSSAQQGAQPFLPQHCLNFLPLLQGQGSLRPTLGPTRMGLAFSIAAAASLTISLGLGAAPGLAVVVVPPKALAEACSVRWGMLR